MRSQTAVHLLVAAIVTAAMPVVLSGTSAAAAADPTCTSTWIGVAGASWTVASNWQPQTVPTGTSDVCIATAAGPHIATGTDVTVQTLVVTGSAVKIDGSLTSSGSFDITDSALIGTGTLTGSTSAASYFSTLTGVQAGGSLAIVVDADLNVRGPRTMCAGTYVLCLTAASHVSAVFRMNVSDGDIGGTTTAQPALSAEALFAVNGSPTVGRIRILVPLDARGVGNLTSGTHRATLDVSTGWNGLAADGTLSGGVNNAGSTPPIVLPRAITAISNGGGVIGDGGSTPAGDNALSTLASINDGVVTLTRTLTITPAGGTLALTGYGSLVSNRGTTTIAGALSVASSSNGVTVTMQTALTVTGALTHSGTGVVEVHGTLRATGSTYQQTAGDTIVYSTGTLRSTGVAIRGGKLVVAGTVDPGGGSVTLASGTTLGGNPAGRCSVGALNGRVSMANDATVQVPLGKCPQVFTATGSVRLAHTLRITRVGHAVPVGTHVVLFDAQAGISGQFTHIVGGTVGGNHWQLDYTATQVTATLVAGPT